MASTWRTISVGIATSGDGTFYRAYL